MSQDFQTAKNRYSWSITVSRKKDLLAEEEKVDFKRTSLMEFRMSYVFYQIYKQFEDIVTDNTLIVTDANIESINKIVRSFDGSIHVETPETAYGRVKPRSQK